MPTVPSCRLFYFLMENISMAPSSELASLEVILLMVNHSILRSPLPILLPLPANRLKDIEASQRSNGEDVIATVQMKLGKLSISN